MVVVGRGGAWLVVRLVFFGGGGKAKIHFVLKCDDLDLDTIFNMLIHICDK